MKIISITESMAKELLQSLIVAEKTRELISHTVAELGPSYLDFIKHLLTVYSKEFKEVPDPARESYIPQALLRSALDVYSSLPDWKEPVYEADFYDMVFQQPPETCFLEPDVYDMIYNILASRNISKEVDEHFEDVVSAIENCISRLNAILFQLGVNEGRDSGNILMRMFKNRNTLFITVA